MHFSTYNHETVETDFFDQYSEKTVHKHVHLFQGAIGPDFIFMDNNAH